MRQNYRNKSRNDGFYNLDLLWDRLTKQGFSSPYALAKHTGVNPVTAYRVFNGTASYKHVRNVSRFLNIDWKLLHDLSLPASQFHRAVLNGDSSSVR